MAWNRHICEQWKQRISEKDIICEWIVELIWAFGDL